MALDQILELLFLGIGAISAIALVIVFNYKNEVEERLEKEIRHSIALEKVIDNYLK